MTAKNFKCEAIAAGKASGPAIISNEAICFYLVEPESGVVIEQKHVLEGRPCFRFSPPRHGTSIRVQR